MFKYKFTCPHCQTELEADFSLEKARVYDKIAVICCKCNATFDIVNTYKAILIAHEEEQKFVHEINADDVLNVRIDLETSSTVEQFLQKVGSK